MTPLGCNFVEVGRWCITSAGRAALPVCVTLGVFVLCLTLVAAPARAQQLLTKWGSEGSSDGQLLVPFGIAVDAGGSVYVADAGNHRIQKFTPSGALLTKFGSLGTGDGELNTPTTITLGPNGNLYVADIASSRIQELTVNGAFVSKFGSEGTGDGQFMGPFGLAFSPAGNLYVGDAGNHRIQVFSPGGTLLNKFGGLGAGDGEFNQPAGLAFGPDGNLYVADHLNHRVQVFTPQGGLVHKFGSQGTGDGQFDRPTGISFDPSGDLYVTEIENDRVQRLTATGSLRSAFGSLGAGDGEFNEPYGVATDCRGNIYVADSGNHRVQKFGVPGLPDPPCPPLSPLAEAAPEASPDRDADGVPDATDNCPDRATADQSDRDRDGIGDACDASVADAPPQVGETVLARVVSGDVFFRPPDGARARSGPAARGSQVPAGFTPIRGAQVMPVGSIVHAVRGRLALTSVATATRGGRTVRTQTADFYAGIFQIQQARGRRPATTLNLRSTNLASVCGSSASGSTATAAQRRPRVVSRLWGNGTGRFRTKGRHSAATVRGTKWLTQERCDGTLTQVQRGIVRVRDLPARRTVTVRAGGSYLARAHRATVRPRTR